ncbi:MAG TPA: hypothetical protein VFR58_12095 [Flavisolibacter sp.]|nr:hypothetical protein [Flavisolibacter sp.]
MKKIFLSLFATAAIFSAKAQWSSSGTHIHNTNSGFVGLGTTNPLSLLHVNGSSTVEARTWTGASHNSSTVPSLLIGKLDDPQLVPALQIATYDFSGQVWAYFQGIRWAQHFKFQRSSPNGTKDMIQLGGSEGGDNYMNVFAGDGTIRVALNSVNACYFRGKLAIGTDNPGSYMLAVNGDAIFTKIKVKAYGTNWPDYVFSSNYRLPSLKEVETFIQKNHHLPGVPSAQEVKNNGIDVTDNQAVLLKKIEELTLYVIELNKRNEQQDAEIKDLRSRLSANNN